MVYDMFMAGQIRRMPNGFWRDPANARAVLEEVLRREGYSLDDAPMVCRKDWFKRHRIAGLLEHVYRGSPYLLLTSLYPGRWQPGDFPEVPKAADLQEAAFAAEGLERADNPMRRWALAKRVRQRRQGRCWMCRAPRAEGSIYCERHREMVRAWQRRRYRQAREQGLCYRCWRRPAEVAGACRPCWERILVVRARQMRRWYWQNRALGLCGHWRCREPAEPGHVYCSRHREEERQRYYRLNYRERARQYKARRKQAKKAEKAE
nr:MAG: hypothetical protein DIU70_06690 [Bacillota bacterium]